MTILKNRLTATLLGLALASPLAATAQSANHDHGHGHGDMQVPMHETSAEVTLGDLVISGGYAFATLPNSPVAGGFVTIINNGTEDDTLVAAKADIAGMVQVHEMAMDGDVMRMRELADGLPIPAGETVTLKPGGYHIMFMKLNGPLVAGEAVDVTLSFEKAGDVQLTMPVVDRPKRGGMNHGKSDG